MRVEVIHVTNVGPFCILFVDFRISKRNISTSPNDSARPEIPLPLVPPLVPMIRLFHPRFRMLSALS